MSRCITECAGKVYEESLKEVGLNTMETRRHGRMGLTIVEVFTIIRGFKGADEDIFFKKKCGRYKRA